MIVVDSRKPCPRCQGLLILRNVVTKGADLEEVHCVQCSRSYQARVVMVYNPMPDISV